MPINPLLIEREPLEYKTDSLIVSDSVMTSKRTFQKQNIKNIFCFGEPTALPACGFQMGVQTQSIQRLHLYLLCSTAPLTVQRWVWIFYTINYVVPKMDSGQMFDVAACLGCWISSWVSLPLVNILIVVTTAIQSHYLLL